MKQTSREENLSLFVIHTRIHATHPALAYLDGALPQDTRQVHLMVSKSIQWWLGQVGSDQVSGQVRNIK